MERCHTFTAALPYYQSNIIQYINTISHPYYTQEWVVEPQTLNVQSRKAFC